MIVGENEIWAQERLDQNSESIKVCHHAMSKAAHAMVTDLAKSGLCTTEKIKILT